MGRGRRIAPNDGAARLQLKLAFLTELGERIHDLHRRRLGEAEIARAFLRPPSAPLLVL
jgi:hypothetical protein